MRFYMCYNDTVGDDTREYEYCPLPFCLLRNRSNSGKIVSTRPSALVYCFSYAHHAEGRRSFQASPISPVSGALPYYSVYNFIFRIQQFVEAELSGPAIWN
jgi:hypothetical protein